MKIFIALTAVLFSAHPEFVLAISEEFTNTNASTSTSTEEYGVPAANTTDSTPTTFSLENNHLDNIIIQDVLSSDKDASEKIEKKIVDSITQYASDCGTYKNKNLSIERFTFPRDSVTFSIGSANVTFYNIRISGLAQNSSEKKSHSTSIECDSTKMVKIEVKLLEDFKISADLKVTKVKSFSNELESLAEILDTGSISLTLKNNSISKQLPHHDDEGHNVTSKIIYSKSVMFLNIAIEFQMPIHKTVDKFYDEVVEPPMSEFLAAKLDEELASNNISLADKCSNFINAESLFNNNTYNFYVIPHPIYRKFEGMLLNPGPILIDGLSSFNHTQLIILGNDVSNSDSGDNYYDIPEMGEVIVKIKTNDLLGKIEWSYNSKNKSIFFALESIQFEVKMGYTVKYGETEQDGYDYNSSESYTRSNTNEINVNLNLGNIQIRPSSYGICQNLSEFVHFVISDYIKTVIADSLKNSLDKKIQNESLIAKCT